jgi:dTDP-4-amino-4,6-dideoxygalactose transaminase
MNVPFVDLHAQYQEIGAETRNAVLAIMERGDFILGRDVGLFEEEFATYCGVKHAVGLDSGTSALELALRACDVGTGDEVITAANTFIATTFAISYTGARPVLIDIDPRTYNMDPACLEAAITPRTKAIIPVHLYGQPADMDPIMAIARRHGLVVIEDACQAHGARYKGRRTGALGHAAAFSFYPSKNLGAYGDGGALVTDDERLARRVRMLREYGQQAKYQHVMLGFNRRLDTLQAAVLRVKLRQLDAWNAARRGHAQRYREHLAGTPLALPEEASQVEHVYHLFVVRLLDAGVGVQRRDELRSHLQHQGIATGIHYPIPIHLQEAYNDLGYGPGSFPITELYAMQALSLPMYAELTPAAVETVVRFIREFADEPAGGR